jgi:hypothetical protein
MKACSSCKVEKTFLEFSKNKSTKDGLQYRCKQCEKDYYWSNRDSIIKKRKESFEENKDLVLTKRAEYYKKHQDKKIAYSRAYREINKEKDLAYKKEHYYSNKEYYANKHREYSEKNKEHLRAYHTKYCAKRRSSDPMYRLVSGIRSRISTMCYSLKMNKNWKTLDAIGCSREDFKAYIESHFVEGMTWDNYGEWHIDHTKPLCTAKTEEDVFTLNHYTNLRPMWWFDNLAKGGKYQEQ